MRPRLKLTTEVIALDSGDICLLRPSADCDLIVEQPDDAIRVLLTRLDGRATAAELCDRLGEAATASALRQLAELGALEDADLDDRLPKHVRSRYDRQLRYFSDIADPPATAVGCQQRLSEATVTILGLGGLGSWAAYALACCGIGRLSLVDGDRVEESNLNRQILYRESDLGLLKAPAAARALRAFASSVEMDAVPQQLSSEAEVADAVRDADFVVDAADRPAHLFERWVNSVCFKLAIPYITMSHFPPVARVGPLYVPGTTGCYACQEATYRRSFPLFDEVVARREGQPSPAASFGPACGLVGSAVALETVHQLTGLCSPSTLGRALIFDLRTMGVSWEPVPIEPDCAVCRPDSDPGRVPECLRGHGLLRVFMSG